MSRRTATPLRRFGSYLLLERLAEGGMGEIYIGRHVAEFRRLCALKMLRRETCRDEELLARFHDEARLMLAMRHPNVVQVRDVGCAEAQWFIEQELVDGCDLAKLLNGARHHRRTLPIPIALFVACKVLRALEYCHQARDATGLSLELVHRDVSPANVLVSFDGEVKLIDFGLAQSTMHQVKTAPHVLFGKPGYLPPERLIGGPADQRSDLFNAGVLLFELLTGERHTTSVDPLALLGELKERGGRLASSIRPAVPPDVDEIIGRAVAYDREHRFGSAAEFREALERVHRRVGPDVGARQMSEWVGGVFDVAAARLRLARLLELSLPERGRRQRYFGLERGSTLVDEQRCTTPAHRQLASLVTEPGPSGPGPSGPGPSGPGPSGPGPSGARSAARPGRRSFGPAHVTTSP